MYNEHKENEADKNKWVGGERGDSQPSCGLFKLMPWLGTPIWKDKPQSHSNVVFGTLAHFGFQMFRLGLLLNPSSMRMFQDLKTFEIWDISVSKHSDKGHSTHAVLFSVSIFSIDCKVSLFWPSEFWLWCVACVTGEDFLLFCSFPRALWASWISKLMSFARF